MSQWIKACKADAIPDEDVIRFDHGDKTFAIYRKDDEYFATDGLCTHEAVHLADGLVMDYTIECPKHNGRFNVLTGEPVASPVRVATNVYETRVNGDKIEFRKR